MPHSRTPSHQWRLYFFIALSAACFSALGQMPDIAADGVPMQRAGNEIPFASLGAEIQKQRCGDDRKVTPAPDGARLNAVFQDLEAIATSEGLWLHSTADEDVGRSDRFRILAQAIRREASFSGELRLAKLGKVSASSQSAAYYRAGLTEEYSVSTDGIRQDFIVNQRLGGHGQLSLTLEVTGARVSSADFGALLSITGSGREIAYSRLKVTDAAGNELESHMHVTDPNHLQLLVNDAGATYPLRIDPTYSDADWISMGGQPGANDDVKALAVDGSGNLYIGGKFTAVGNVAAKYLAMWNGSTWSSVGSGVNDYVYALAVLGSEVFIQGNFTVAGGLSAGGIASWNGTSWTILPNLGFVADMVSSGTSIYAAAASSGLSIYSVYRWGGASWTKVGPDFHGTVLTLAASGSDVVAAGNFSMIGAANINKIARWNGTTWTALGTGTNNEVMAVVIAGTNVYAGGQFTAAGGISANHVARWNGSAWSALGSGVDSTVYGLAMSGSDLIVGKSGVSGDGFNASCIVKWNGSTWSDLGSGIDGSVVDEIAVVGNRIYAGGEFKQAGQAGATFVAQWDGTDWSALGAGFSGSVNAIVGSGSDVYVGGAFALDTAGGRALRMAKWDGNAWSKLGAGLNGSVIALAQKGNEIYAAGTFTKAGTVDVLHVARWDGSAWHSLGSGVGLDDGSSYASGLAVSGNDLYVCGFFTTAGGVSAKGIAKWNGSAWSALGTGLSNNRGSTLAVSGSDLFVGGYFTSAGGVNATGIAKWNGSQWSALGSGLELQLFIGWQGAFVDTIVTHGGNVYAGGRIDRAGGLSVNNIAKWDGSEWSAVGSGLNGEVTSLTLYGDDLFAGGAFGKAGTVEVSDLAKWNGTAWAPVGTGVSGTASQSGYILAMAVVGKSLFVGGDFAFAGGKISPVMARLDLNGHPEISVEQPIGTALIDGALSVVLGASYVGQTTSKTFTVRNDGAAPLTGISVSKDGPDANSFVINASGVPETLAPDQTAFFTVTYSASTSTVRSAALHITSNDADENPFDIPLVGQAGPIATFTSASGIVMPSWEDAEPYPSVIHVGGISGTVTKVRVQLHGLTHNNPDDIDMFLMGPDGRVAALMSDAGGTADVASIDLLFDQTAATAIPDSTALTTGIYKPFNYVTGEALPPGGSSSVGADITALANQGANGDWKLFVTDDSSGSGMLLSWSLQIETAASATAVVPEIEVSAGGSPFVNEASALAYGAVNTGTPLTKTITIRNTGGAALTDISSSITGLNSADFSVAATSDSVQPGNQISLDVTFTPHGTGSRTALLSIISNDADQNPFKIALNGTGSAACEIVVESPSGTELAAGVSTLDFGTVNNNATGVKTVVIRNVGTSSLTNIAVTVMGAEAAEFTTSALGVTALAPGAFAPFTLTFAPEEEGAYTATLRITSNDGDENPFDIALTGDGHVPLPPHFTSDPSSQLLVIGATAAFSATVTGDPTITYQWKKGSAAIKNALANHFTIDVTKASDAGAYTLVADNPVGPPVPSQPAYLGLVTLSQGTQLVKKGGTLSLKCTATAPASAGVSLRYSWRRSGETLTDGTKTNGATVSGANKPTLSIVKIGTADTGQYTCLVTLDTPGNDPQAANGDTSVIVVEGAPVLDPVPLPGTISVSETIDVQLTASNFVASFSAANLPVGLKFDTKTGRLTGKATVPTKKDNQGNDIPTRLTFKASNVVGTSEPVFVDLIIKPLHPNCTGTFTGIVPREPTTTLGLGGLVQITVASTGVISGSAILAGGKHSVVGTLDIDNGAASAELLVKRTPASLGNLQLHISINSSLAIMQGSMSDPGFELLGATQILGNRMTASFLNGTRAQALFNSPSGIAWLSDGSGYIADTGNHVIRRIQKSGDVTTFAGTAGQAGSANGTGTGASFDRPQGLVLDSAGNLYVADAGNAIVRKITPAGVVTTLAGAPDLIGSSDGSGASARFSQPCALSLDPANNLYVVDRGNHTIRKITSLGVVTTIAGKANNSGFKDGSGSLALFKNPCGIVYDPYYKCLFIADTGNFVVRKVSLSGITSTYAGTAGVQGHAAGLLANARFYLPSSIVSLGDGNLIVGDQVLVQISRNGVVSIVSDYVDSSNHEDHPTALCWDASQQAVLAVHDSLHGVSSHEFTGLHPGTDFHAFRNPWSPQNYLPAVQQGIYNNGFSALTAAPELPQGDGFVQLTLAKTGIATWTGRAGDGAAFTSASIIASDLTVPVHAMLYQNTGSIQGETAINSTTLDVRAESGAYPFDWLKIAPPLSSTDRSYKTGIALHTLKLTGAKYAPGSLHSYLASDTAVNPLNCKLDFDSSRIAGFIQTFKVTAPNAIAIPSPVKSLTLKVDSQTGLFTGSFKEGMPAVSVPFAGILMDPKAIPDDSGFGFGHYLLPDSAAPDAPIRSFRVRLGTN